MTNFEYLKTLSLDELADFLCMIITDCRACSMKNKCNRLRMDGFQKLLSEGKDEKE